MSYEYHTSLLSIECHIIYHTSLFSIVKPVNINDAAKPDITFKQWRHHRHDSLKFCTTVLLKLPKVTKYQVII